MSFRVGLWCRSGDMLKANYLMKRMLLVALLGATIVGGSFGAVVRDYVRIDGLIDAPLPGKLEVRPDFGGLHMECAGNLFE